MRHTIRCLFLFCALTGICGPRIASAQQIENQDPVEALRQQLAQQQAAIQQLQAQVASQQSAPANPPGIPASPTGYSAAAADAGGPSLPPGATTVGNSPVALNAYWNNGLMFQSANQDFKVHVGGRIQFDAFNDFAPDADFKSKSSVPFELSQGFRRDRVRMDGTIYDSIDFVWEYDFATGVNPKNIAVTNGAAAPNTIANANSSSVFTGTGITDMNATLKYVPVVGNVTVGSFLCPFSFELTTSDRWMDFIERSAAFDAFVPETNDANYTLGLKTFDWNEDQTATYAASVTTNNMWNGASGFDLGSDYMVNGRLTWLPYYDEPSGGRYMAEVGIDGCFQECQVDPLATGIDKGQSVTQLRSRLATREYLSSLTPTIVNTGVIAGKNQNTLGLEFIGQSGPISYATEYYGSWVTDDNGLGGAANGPGSNTLFFKGMYAQVMYMLTGENRNYNRQKAAYERVVPYEDYVRIPGQFEHCGLGAWQIGARYSYVDLNDMGVHGGVDNEFTAGLNWFLNPNLKFQFNYDYTATSGGGPLLDGNVSGFGTRMDLDF